MKPEKEKILSVLKDLSPVLMEKYGVTKIGIFGSVARNQSVETSDVDIVYEMLKPNGFTAVHLKEELEKKLHHPVELVRYRDRMNPLLKKRIDNEGVYV
jgi:predicted nucleotidyltransferase